MDPIEAPLLESPAPEFHMGPFFQEVYRYWRGKGAMCIAARDAADLAVAAFIGSLLLFLCNAMDYPALARRTGRPECPDGRPNDTPIFGPDCYGETPVRLDRMLEMHAGLWAVAAVCAAVWAWRLLRLLLRVPGLCRMRGFYSRALGLTDRTVQTAPWELVLRRILDVQDEYALLASDAQVTELQAVHCITRRADFLVALVHEGVVRPRLPVPGLGAVPFWPLCLDLSFAAALDGTVYDGHRVLATAATVHAVGAALKRRLLALAAAMLLLSPLVFVFRVAESAFRHSDEWRRRPSALAARCWTPPRGWRCGATASWTTGSRPGSARRGARRRSTSGCSRARWARSLRGWRWWCWAASCWSAWG